MNNVKEMSVNACYETGLPSATGPKFIAKHRWRPMSEMKELCK